MFILVLLQKMRVYKCPSDELSLTNCAIGNKDDFDPTEKYLHDMY